MNRRRLAALHRELARIHGELADVYADGEAASDWIDQDSSPLGRRRHLALARDGVLPSSKDGRRVLVKRADIDAYLTRKSVVKADPAADEEREVARVVSMMGGKRRTG